jgi:hypothetical protein
MIYIPPICVIVQAVNIDNPMIRVHNNILVNRVLVLSSVLVRFNKESIIVYNPNEATHRVIMDFVEFCKYILAKTLHTNINNIHVNPRLIYITSNPKSMANNADNPIYHIGKYV